MDEIIAIGIVCLSTIGWLYLCHIHTYPYGRDTRWGKPRPTKPPPPIPPIPPRPSSKRGQYLPPED